MMNRELTYFPVTYQFIKPDSMRRQLRYFFTVQEMSIVQFMMVGAKKEYIFFSVISALDRGNNMRKLYESVKSTYNTWFVAIQSFHPLPLIKQAWGGLCSLSRTTGYRAKLPFSTRCRISNCEHFMALPTFNMEIIGDYFDYTKCLCLTVTRCRTEVTPSALGGAVPDLKYLSANQTSTGNPFTFSHQLNFSIGAS